MCDRELLVMSRERVGGVNVNIAWAHSRYECGEELVALGDLALEPLDTACSTVASA